MTSREYTAEDVRKILAGLNSGPARPHRPASDEEWERHWDPVAYWEKRKVIALETIAVSYNRPDTEVMPQRPPSRSGYQSFRPSAKPPQQSQPESPRGIQA